MKRTRGPVPTKTLNVVDARDLLMSGIITQREVSKDVPLTDLLFKNDSLSDLLFIYLGLIKNKKLSKRRLTRNQKAGQKQMLDFYQDQIDGLLQRVLDGDDARTVFKLEYKKRGRRRDEFKDRAMALESARLRRSDGVLDSSTVEMIAEKFKVEPITVRRNYKNSAVTSAELTAYVETLKAHGRL